MAGELFIDVFSDLSMRKKHGRLKVALPSRVLEIGVIDGRIQSVDVPGFSMAKRVLSRLVKAQKLSAKIEKTVSAAGGNITLSQLLAALEARNYLSRENFLSALRAETWDLLLSLRFVEDAQCDFEPEAIRPDPIFTLELFPGHVLLELIDFEKNEQLLAERIGGSPEVSPDFIVSDGEPERRLLPAEQVLLNTVGDGLAVRELFTTSLLSVAEISQSMLALLEFGVIRILSAQEFESRQLEGNWVPEENLSQMTVIAPGQKSSQSTAQGVTLGMIEARMGGAVEEVVKTSVAVSSLVESELWGRNPSDGLFDADMATPDVQDSESDEPDLISNLNLWEENLPLEGEIKEHPKTSGRAFGKFKLVDNLNVYSIVIFLAALAVTVPTAVDRLFRALQDMGLGQ